jgi:hypothetical protein
MGKAMTLDDIKVTLASVTGLGNWLVTMDMFLKVGISLASLLYIVLKIKQLLENRSK